MPYARIGETATFFQSAGTGVPVLFVHGGVAGAEPRFRVLSAPDTARLTSAEDALAALQLPARIVGYHRRGHGLSDPSPQEYSLADLAGDVRGLLDHLELDRVALIGHSIGGLVALQAALDHPDRVASLCLASTGAALLSADDRFGRGNLARFYANVSADVALSRSEGIRPAFETRKEGMRQTNDRAPAGMAEWLASLSEDALFDMYQALLHDCAAFLGVDLSPRLGELRMPVTVIHGAEDRWVPIANGRHLHDEIAHSSWCELPSAGHSNIFGAPEGVTAITHFIELAAAAIETGP